MKKDKLHCKDNAIAQ